MKPAFFLGLLWVALVGVAWPLSGDGKPSVGGARASATAPKSVGRLLGAWHGGKDKTELLKLGLPALDFGPESSPRIVEHLLDSPAVTSVVLSNDGKWLVTGSFDDASLWELSSGKEIRRFQGHTSSVVSVTLSVDGKWLATGSWDHTARLWEVSSGKEIRSFQGHTDKVIAVALSSHGKWLATGSWDKTARLWELSSGKEIRRFKGHADLVTSVALSGDGKRLVTGSLDRTARLWEVSSRKLARSIEGHTRGVSSVALSGDGRRLVTGSWDDTARWWEVVTGQEVRCFRGHTGGVTSVALSRDVKWLFTGSDDSTTRIWSVWGPNNGKEVCHFLSFRDGTWAVIDPEGRYDCSNDGDIQHLHWVIGMETFPLKKFKDRYYDPGLLVKHLGLHNERPREVKATPR